MAHWILLKQKSKGHWLKQSRNIDKSNSSHCPYAPEKPPKCVTEPLDEPGQQNCPKGHQEFIWRSPARDISLSKEKQQISHFLFTGYLYADSSTFYTAKLMQRHISAEEEEHAFLPCTFWAVFRWTCLCEAVQKFSGRWSVPLQHHSNSTNRHHKNQ